MGKRIYFVAGEASGDDHGAALMHALREVRPAVEFRGRGGPKMAQLAGANFRDWLNEAAVLGLWEVVKRYGFFRREFAATLNEISAANPDAVVLIDYPGFNLRLAHALRKRGARAKIICYISPQVWAWNRRRIPQMARSLDLMLCIFPFEAELYNKSNLRTIFVGHPMATGSDMSDLTPDEERDPDMIALLPGSREREVRQILPIMLDAAERIAEHRPSAVFEIKAPSEHLAAVSRSIAEQRSLRINIGVGKVELLMHLAIVGLVASGTATLQAALLGMPFVLVYKVAWPTYLAARLVVRVPHLGMPNVLAGREVVPEFIQHKAKPEAIAAAALRLIDEDDPARTLQLDAFKEIRAQLGRDDASAAAANAIVSEIAA